MPLPWWLNHRETLLQAQRFLDKPFGQRTATVFHSVASCLRRSRLYRAEIVSVPVSNRSHAPEFCSRDAPGIRWGAEVNR